MNSRAHRHACQAGLTITEYATLIGLLSILSITGLTALGGSIQDLIKGSQSTLNEKSTLTLLESKPSSGSGTATGSGGASSWRGGGYYAITIDPATGQPTLTLVEGNSAGMKNVTGVEGGQMNLLGTLRLAQALEKQAKAQTDPDLRAYYADLARTAYYLGGTEGELDYVSGLRIDWVDWENAPTEPSGTEGYTTVSGIRDLMYFKSQLEEKLNNPPVYLNQEEFKEVMPLAVEVFNIANNYYNHFDEQLALDGQLPKYLGNPDNCNLDKHCAVGSGAPGSAMTNYQQITTDMKYADGTSGDAPKVLAINARYDELVSYDELKKNARAFLALNPMETTPVVTTLQNAEAIDTHSTPPSSGSTQGR